MLGMDGGSPKIWNRVPDAALIRTSQALNGDQSSRKNIVPRRPHASGNNQSKKVKRSLL